MSKYPRCAGIVVFNEDYTKVLLVNTKSGNYGFGKGKLEKKEHFIVGAFRENQEETNIKPNDMLIIKNQYIDEINHKGMIIVRYLVGKVINDITQYNLKPMDRNEIDGINWYTIENANKILWPQRQCVLEKALNLVKSSVDFENGKTIVEPFIKLIDSYREMKISKNLSWILRHGAFDLGLTLDSEGWCLLDDILKLEQLQGVTEEEIQYVVQNNDKQRFSIKNNNNKIYIRANQGHSNELATVVKTEKLLQEIIKPLDIAVHGTTLNAWKHIETTGLKTMNRMHIHFATGDMHDKTVISGMRSNSKVLIYLDMEKAMNDNIKFYMSDNGVVLTEGIDKTIEPKYFKKVVFM